MLDPFLWTALFVVAGLLVVCAWLAGPWKTLGGVVLVTIIAAGLCAGGTQWIRNSAPLSALHPELADRALDSAEVPGNGFPCCQWAYDDSRHAVLWDGLSLNILFFFLPLLVLFSCYWFVLRKMRETAGQGSGGLERQKTSG